MQEYITKIKPHAQCKICGTKDMKNKILLRFYIPINDPKEGNIKLEPIYSHIHFVKGNILLHVVYSDVMEGKCLLVTLNILNYFLRQFINSSCKKLRKEVKK